MALRRWRWLWIHDRKTTVEQLIELLNVRLRALADFLGNGGGSAADEINAVEAFLWNEGRPAGGGGLRLDLRPLLVHDHAGRDRGGPPGDHHRGRVRVELFGVGRVHEDQRRGAGQSLGHVEGAPPAHGLDHDVHGWDLSPLHGVGHARGDHQGHDLAATDAPEQRVGERHGRHGVRGCWWRAVGDLSQPRVRRGHGNAVGTERGSDDARECRHGGDCDGRSLRRAAREPYRDATVFDHLRLQQRDAGAGGSGTRSGDGDDDHPVRVWRHAATLTIASTGSAGTSLYDRWDPFIPPASPHADTDEFTSNTIANWTGVYTGDAGGW
jgi:hypothetical protein